MKRFVLVALVLALVGGGLLVRKRSGSDQA
jgi:hypothetical protein